MFECIYGAVRVTSVSRRELVILVCVIQNQFDNLNSVQEHSTGHL